MKKLYLIRHAKSSWAQMGLTDFDRPLNERGKKDAPEMAKRLLKTKANIDAMISSPALRAKSTAILFSKELDIKEKKIIYIDELYHADMNNFLSVIENADDDYKAIALFSHNPGITDFANSLAIKVQIDNLPTSGIFAVEADVKKWKDFTKSEKNFLFFDYPKKFDKS